MEADISTWQKTGHFYFALTRSVTARGSSPDAVLGQMGSSTNFHNSRSFDIECGAGARSVPAPSCID